MTDSPGVANNTVMEGNTDDVMIKPSYGWLFSTLTALGLILFLGLSFAFHHRRLLLKRKKEQEYNSFFRHLRPDLYKFEKITRARSILTNTHNVDTSFIYNDLGNDNEAYEGDSMDNSDDNEVETKVSYAEWVEKQSQGAKRKQIEDQATYLRSVQARKQMLLADIHSEPMLRDSNECAGKSGLESDTYRYDKREDDAPDDKNVDNEKLSSSAMQTKDKNIKDINPAKDNTFRPSSCTLVAHKPPLLKSKTDLMNKTDVTLKKKTSLKPIKAKKKKPSLLSRTKKEATSLDIENRDNSVFYSEPRRSSEPGLFLDNEEAADPKDSKYFGNQNKVLFNPYYTDVSIPVNSNQRRRSSLAEDEYEIDAFKQYSFKREHSLPVLDELYDKHVPASTWM